jgi:hypothetical protein
LIDKVKYEFGILASNGGREIEYNGRESTGRGLDIIVSRRLRKCGLREDDRALARRAFGKS